MVLAAAGMAGCAGQPLSGLLRAQDTQQVPSGVSPPVAFAPIIGAPANVAQPLTTQLESAAKQRSVTVVSGRDAKPSFTVRGYLAASPEGNQAKIAYIWDVTDADNKRVHRIAGEELVPAPAGGNPWAGVDEAAVQRIATKTATDLSAWLPKDAAPRTVAVRPGPAQGPSDTAAPGEVLTYVPAVSGAPGDGQKSLTLAIKKELFRHGIKVAGAPGAATHTVRGTVRMTRADGGKQNIAIEWQVLDPSGRRLGTVSQSNTIAQGALDGPWGATADAAAGAAADGILKLLPRPRT